MSHKRKPTLHKVRKCPYMCVVVVTDRVRVAFVCQQVNFASKWGLTFPATNPAFAQNPNANKSHVITTTFRRIFFFLLSVVP